jgi:hypothetical protein
VRQRAVQEYSTHFPRNFKQKQMFQPGCLLPADLMVMQRLQAHLSQMGGKYIQMGGKYIQMQVYFCHFRRFVFKTGASKKCFRMNRPTKKNGFTVHLYEEQNTKEHKDINFPLVIYGKSQNAYIRRTQQALLGKSNLRLYRNKDKKQVLCLFSKCLQLT